MHTSSQGKVRRLFGRLLQNNEPVPHRSEEGFFREVERHYRWNFTVNTLDVASFFFSISFISAGTIVPLYISKLSTSALPVGIAAMLAQSSWYLPQLFTANLIERLPRMKPIVVNLGFFLERLPIWVLVLSTFFALQAPKTALLLFLLGLAWHGLGAGTIAPAWQDLVARCFPIERRGRFLGLGTFLGTGTGVAGAGVSTWLLSTYAYPRNFGYIFALSGVAILLSLFFLSLTREPIPPHTPPRQTQRQYLSTLPQILKKRRNFRRFLIARLLMTMGGMGAGFIALSAIRSWGTSDTTIGIFTGLQLLGQGLGTLLLGLLADRQGHKLSLELGALASLVGFIIAVFAPSERLLALTFLLVGFSFGGQIVSGVLVVMEFAEPEKRPTYIGIASFAVGIAGLIAPLVGAGLAGVSYRLLFSLSAFTHLIALMAMRFWVQEPRLTTEDPISAFEKPLM